MRKPKAAFLNNGPQIDSVYGQGRRTRVADLTDVYPDVVSAETFEDHRAALVDVEAVFSTWGMPALSAEQIAEMPALKAVFYAAGSVQNFARPFLERDVTVVSAWVANGMCVAEFTLAQILLSCKGYFRNTQDCRSPEKRRGGGVVRGRGVFGATVALVGIGAIGRAVAAMLKPFNTTVLGVDPYLPEDQARALDLEMVSLEEAFERAYVVSNHLPNLPTLQGVLTGKLFSAMPHGATFINTGRGAQVQEDGLIRVLNQRPDLTALLDVTAPEPPKPESELYTLPNVQLSSHIAGAMNNEVVRMADTAIEEFISWRDGQPLRYSVSLEQLEIMA
ncbi:MAG: hydroxyacid dehydrogenase [Lentisphaerae bacterium]|nr:hydroxyacid dehydrogenase [Lentisphaerota bacterium]MBT4815550.1 hydroxyacid dehydrogenase [Lentisphaerota bacterium]MBT5613217.1 hydroxyacid dehydrogenase [Lentisphaerota bacterium]MBT7062120.1 hydroxyacid dehydrogenase [Lentisphaerota bacterium]MBT7847632.1 hydroxyacid dehydrogenase [Lentisphaerota bacterium]